MSFVSWLFLRLMKGQFSRERRDRLPTSSAIGSEAPSVPSRCSFPRPFPEKSVSFTPMPTCCRTKMHGNWPLSKSLPFPLFRHAIQQSCKGGRRCSSRAGGSRGWAFDCQAAASKMCRLQLGRFSSSGLAAKRPGPLPGPAWPSAVCTSPEWVPARGAGGRA